MVGAGGDEEFEPAVRTDEAPQLIVLSARTKDSLREYCLRLIGFLRGGIAPAGGHGVEHEWLPALREDLLTFTAEILRLKDRNTHLEPITTADYGAPAPRPAYSVLDNSRVRALAGCPPLPTWQAALAEYLSTDPAGQPLRS